MRPLSADAPGSGGAERDASMARDASRSRRWFHWVWKSGPVSSPNLLRALQPQQHRGSIDMPARELGVARDVDELREPLALDSWIGLLQRALVADRHFLHLFDRYGTALARIDVEHVVRCFAAPHPAELFAKIDRVMNAAVETKAAERIVEVRGVATEQHVADPERVGDALVHAIDAL